MKERAEHIQAIETARNKKLYDVDHKFVDSVIDRQGREEHDQFLHIMKKIGAANVKPLETELLERQAKHLKLLRWSDKWESLMDKVNITHPRAVSESL